ncbi:sodium-dependent proline transporter-like [Ornithodoros turicata]|uniref:sodium-dependent proline transporter-like n=1 Tax=Ornithodoros turicata TaxID=34597 RepID=UPI0031392D60
MAEREKWSSNIEFICSCIGYSVGLGNLWRFPYVAYKNGGAAFVIPYITVNLLIGRPIYYLELLLGQFSSHGPLGAFRVCPMFQGNAFGMMWGAFVTTIYYQMIITYCVLYLYHSFKTPLPWTQCFEWWDVPLAGCYVRTQSSHLCESVRKTIVASGVNDTAAAEVIDVTFENKTVSVSFEEYNSLFAGCIDGNSSSTEFFFNRYVLNMSSSFEHVGQIQPSLLLCYATCWTIIFLLIFQGIQVVGKVVLITATAPYVILTVMLIRGITLQGSDIGLRYLLLPKWESLLDPSVWRAATEQCFYSLSIGTGGLLVYGGFQEFHGDMRKSVYFICFVDFFTSAFSSIVVFSILGNMSYNLHVPIEDVVSKGPGLAFVTYPEALSLIPFSNLWAVLFFSMLFFLGVDSQMANCEFLTTSIMSLFPALSRSRTFVVFGYSLFCFSLGLSLTTQAGMYVLTILDNYLGALIVLFTCLAETLIVGWVYGINRFCFDITFMSGHSPGYFFLVAIKYMSPVSLIAFLIYTLYTFPRSNVGAYILPLWSDIFGWCLALVGLAPLPIIALARWYNCNFSWKKAIAPERDWGPYDPRERSHYRERLYDLGYSLPEVKYAD